jgi:hypothetical protein
VVTIESNAHDIHHLVDECCSSVNGGVGEKGKIFGLCLKANTLFVPEIMDPVPVDDGEFFEFSR